MLSSSLKEAAMDMTSSSRRLRATLDLAGEEAWLVGPFVSSSDEAQLLSSVSEWASSRCLGLLGVPPAILARMEPISDGSSLRFLRCFEDPKSLPVVRGPPFWSPLFSCSLRADDL